MDKLLLFVHFVGLVMGFSGGIGAAVTMRFAGAASPGDAAVLKRLPPVFANISAIGLVLLWVTGLILIWSAYGGPGNLPALFWLKIFFVLLLTLFTGLQHATLAAIRRTGNAALGARMKVFGPAGGLSALVAMFIAVLVFN